MSPSFEEMADAGVPSQALSSQPPQRSGARNVLALAGLGVLAAAAGFYFLGGEAEELPEAARILLVVDEDESETLPHVLDDSTEFAPSFDFLKIAATRPGFRETEEGMASSGLIRVESGVWTEEALSAPVASAGTRAAGAALPSPVGAVPPATEATVAEPLSVQVDRSRPVRSLEDVVNPEVVFSRDWGGTVLVPDGIQLAKAYTSDVRLARVEAHPVDGERLRVWTRIKNLTPEPLAAEVGCEFRSRHAGAEAAQFVPTIIPEGGVVDVYFASTGDRVRSYTILVKRTR